MSKLPEPVEVVDIKSILLPGRIEVAEPVSNYYTAEQLEQYAKDHSSALQSRITELEALSVTNIMLDVVPGEFGEGVEVYAKCCDDVVNVFNKLYDRIDVLEAELADCRKEASKHRFLNVSCSQCGRDFGPGNFGFSHCDDHTGWSYNLGIITAANFIDAKADAYDRNHGKTDPETGEREYPGDGLDYISELREMADDIRRLKHTSANPAVDLAESSLVKNAERYLWLRDKSVPPHNFYISVTDEFKDVRYQPEEVDSYIDAAVAAGSVEWPVLPDCGPEVPS